MTSRGFSKRTREHAECVSRAIGILLSRRDVASFRRIICDTDSSREPVNSAALFVPAIYSTRPAHRIRENELLVGAISKPAAALMEFAQRMGRSIAPSFQIA